MAGRAAASPLLLGGALAAALGAVSADVALAEHPTHSVVLGVVAAVATLLSRLLTCGVTAALPTVARAVAAQPVLHLGAEALRPDVVLPAHTDHLLHMLVDDAATATVQIVVPVFVIVAVAVLTRLVWLVVDSVRSPLASPPRSAVPVRPVLVRVRPAALGSMLRWCGWAILAARRGPPGVPAHAVS